MSIQRYMHDLIDQYLTERVSRGEVTLSSARVIRYVLRGFAAQVAHLEPDEISEVEVEAWLGDDALRPATRRSMLAKLRPFIRWCAVRGHLPRDFTALLKTPKVPRGMPRFLAPEQVASLVAAAGNTRDRLILLLMVQLGLRRIEVARILLDDVDLRDRLLAVRGKNGRGEVTRSVPITEEAHSAIIAYLAERPVFAGPLVRSLRDGGPVAEEQVGAMVARLMLAV